MLRPTRKSLRSRVLLYLLRLSASDLLTRHRHYMLQNKARPALRHAQVGEPSRIEVWLHLFYFETTIELDLRASLIGCLPFADRPTINCFQG